MKNRKSTSVYWFLMYSCLFISNSCMFILCGSLFVLYMSLCKQEMESESLFRFTFHMKLVSFHIPNVFFSHYVCLFSYMRRSHSLFYKSSFMLNGSLFTVHMSLLTCHICRSLRSDTESVSQLQVSFHIKCAFFHIIHVSFDSTQAGAAAASFGTRKHCEQQRSRCV